MVGDALDVGDCLCLVTVSESIVTKPAHGLHVGGGIDIVCVGAVEAEPRTESDALWTFDAACSADRRHVDEPIEGAERADRVVCYA